ncbi:dienelactone hydrolase [Thozetella sp. PMI_491]|nr:dienelactone hydrolase [Thozetella sp. PMI_491]
MNIDIPKLVKAAVPEAEGRNARIISEHHTNYRDPGFLSKDFPRSPPKLYVTAETEDFDPLTLSEWRDEGFNVEYIAMGAGGDEYRRKLVSLSRRKMDPCETFGIIAYGDAAALCLEHYHIMDNNPEYKLGLLVAYYPTAIPDPQGRFPSSIVTLVHLAAGEEIKVTKQTQMVGIQGKRRTIRRKIESGIGTGGTLRLAYKSYTYNAAPGFAEHDLDDYDRIPSELAWSRSLAAARKAFAKDDDVELVLEENVQGKFFTRNLNQTLSTYTTHKSPHVTHIPTLTGGIGAAELERFYSQFFSNPPTMKLTLLSRTLGGDRVVDEVHVRFKHTQSMPWILPGVPPTNKRVEILVVSIVALRGGKLFHEHVYWDQASVLLQVGLLDPKLLPEAARNTGVERLPVIGREAARRVPRGWDPDEEGEADNELIPEWDDSDSDDEGKDEDKGSVKPTSSASQAAGAAKEHRGGNDAPSEGTVATEEKAKVSKAGKTSS